MILIATMRKGSKARQFCIRHLSTAPLTADAVEQSVGRGVRVCKSVCIEEKITERKVDVVVFRHFGDPWSMWLSLLNEYEIIS